jgi:hypothetical protein
MSNQKLHIPNIHKVKIKEKIKLIEELNENTVKWMGSRTMVSYFIKYLQTKYKSECQNIEALEFDFLKTDDINEEKLQNDMNDFVCHFGNDNKVIVIPFNLKRDSIGHSNLVILRQIDGIIYVEHFEPHGRGFLHNDNAIRVKNFINSFAFLLEEKTHKEVRVEHTDEICPEFGFQALESKISNEGFCAAWSLFFTELVLSNPKLKSKEIMDIIYEEINDDIQTAEGKAKWGKYFYDLILGYVHLLDSKLRKYEGLSLADVNQKIKDFKNNKENKIEILKMMRLLKRLDYPRFNDISPATPSVHLSQEKQASIHISPEKQASIHVSPEKQASIHISPEKQPSIHVSPEKQPSIHISPEKQPSIHISPEKQPFIYVSPEKQAFIHIMHSPQSIDYPINKRCPNGFKRNKKTQRCQKNNNKTHKQISPIRPIKPISPMKQISPMKPISYSPQSIDHPINKRCPNGFKRNKKTQRCQKK